MTYEIEDNIPIPPRGARGRPRKYPFLDMEPGQSVFLPGRVPGAGSGPLSYVRKRHPERKFASRAMTCDGVAGVRIWRVE